jgi:hypothetical protein
VSANLAHSVVVSLAGVGVRVTSNSAAVTDAFVERYGGAATGPVATAPLCEVVVHVEPGSPRSMQDVAVSWQYPDDDHANASAPGFSSALDLAACSATVRVDQALVPRHPVFRRAVLEGTPLSILNRCDRHPVHSSCVRQGSAALVLHGASGAGKSTLAYVAHRAGIEALSDDSTRVQLSPELRIWGEGDARSLHLMLSAKAEFPELRDLEPDWLSAGGVTKLSVRPGSLDRAQLPYATTARVCLLSRGTGSVARRHASASEIREALLSAPEGLADRAPAQRVRVADALAAPGGWYLKLSSDPSEAIPYLRDMLDELSRGAPNG